MFVENRWYASLGCWKDTESFAVGTLEGSDALLQGLYVTREKPIDTCAQVARKHDYKGESMFSKFLLCNYFRPISLGLFWRFRFRFRNNRTPGISFPKRTLIGKTDNLAEVTSEQCTE